MPVKKGTSGVSAVYKGTTEIAKIYKGTTLVYQNRLLPEGYAECEYLESSGTQYIDTGYYSKSNSVYDMVIGDKSSVDTNAAGTIFGSSFGPALRYLTTGELRGGYNTGSWQSNSVTILDRNVIHMPSSTAYYNGTQITLGNGSNTNYKIAIFANFSNQSGTGIGGYGKIKIYRFKIYTGSTCERDFVPCLDTHGVPCMYDTVTKQPFYNAGTGQFSFKIKKDIIPANYTRCEYLESSGTQRFDTGIACNNAYKWEYDLMQLTAGTANTCVNGAIEQVGTNTYSRFHNVNNTSNQWKFYVGLNDLQSTYTNVGANVRQRISVDATSIPASVKIGSQTDSLAFGSYANVTSLTFWLFGRNSNVEAYKFFTTERIYSFNVSNAQGKLVMQLVPCLDASFRPCMYDSVSKQTFYNQGTGEFLYKISQDGLPPGYTRKAWIQSTNTSVIESPPYPRLVIPYNFKDTMTLRWVESAASQSNNLAIFNGTTRISYMNPWSSQGKFAFNYNGSVTRLADPAPVSNKIYDMRLTPNGGYVDDQQITTANAVNYPDGVQITNALYTSRYYISISKTYLIQILSGNGDILLNAVPCLDENNVPCMYDTVSGAKYTKNPSTANDFLFG